MMKLKLYAVWTLTLALFAKAWGVRYLMPEPVVVDSQVYVKITTDSPVSSPNLYYEEFAADAHLTDYLFEFYLLHDSSDTDWLLPAKYVKPGKLYRYIVAVTTKGGRRILSKESTFRIIETEDGLKIGLSFEILPFANVLDSNTAVVAWKVNKKPDIAIVEYGLKGLKRRVEVRPKSARIEVKLSDLTPSQIYAYRTITILGNDTLVGPISTIKTPRRQGERFKFVVLSDSRTNWHWPNPYDQLNGVAAYSLRHALAEAMRHDPDFIIFMGDLIQGYTSDTTYARIQFETWLHSAWTANSKVSIYEAVGNHDASSPLVQIDRRNHYDPPPPNSAEDLWAEIFVLPTNGPESADTMPPYKENVYSFDWGDAHFVILNCDYLYHRVDGRRSPAALDSVQLAWLRSDLERNRDKRIFVVYHEPIFPMSLRGGEFEQDMADTLLKLFSDYGVQAVLNGHEHLYARLRIDSTLSNVVKHPFRQIISGRAGAPKYRVNTERYGENLESFSQLMHYVVIEVSASGVHYQVYDLDGNLIDEWREP